MKLHPALNLIHHGPVCQGVQVSERCPTVHGVLLLGVTQEEGKADAVPHHDEGPGRALTARRRPACSWPSCPTPTCLITNIFVLMGNIGGWGWERSRAGRHGRTQEPEGWRGWG